MADFSSFDGNGACHPVTFTTGLVSAREGYLPSRQARLSQQAKMNKVKGEKNCVVTPLMLIVKTNA
jgi:hypothetical protein